MKGISEVSDELNITSHMLRDWEKRGYLGDVIQLRGRRMYDDQQVEKIKYISEQAEKQKSERTDYLKIDAALLEKYGGMIEEIPQSQNQVVSTILDQLKQRDNVIKNDLNSIKNLLESFLELSPSEIPDTTHQNELLTSIQQNLLKKIERLEYENKDLTNENSNLRIELEIEKRRGFWKRFNKQK